MVSASTYSRHERALMRRLRLLGLDQERSNQPRDEFRVGLRDRLVAAAAGRHDDRIAC
jgi:hypothetical protein